jgi:hypothetical protein
MPGPPRAQTRAARSEPLAEDEAGFPGRTRSIGPKDPFRALAEPPLRHTILSAWPPASRARSARPWARRAPGNVPLVPCPARPVRSYSPVHDLDRTAVRMSRHSNRTPMFRSYVLRQRGSKSIPSLTSTPAFLNPRVMPPHPQKKSMPTGLGFTAIASRMLQ